MQYTGTGTSIGMKRQKLFQEPNSIQWIAASIHYLTK